MPFLYIQFSPSSSINADWINLKELKATAVKVKTEIIDKITTVEFEISNSPNCTEENIYKIIDDSNLVHDNYDKLYVISKDYINIRIIPMNNKKYYKMFIMINLFIKNHMCICDLIFYYTHRYYYCKKFTSSYSNY